MIPRRSDINKLCQLYDMVEKNLDAPGSSLMQSHAKLNKSKANLDSDTPWSPIAHLLVQMGEIPEISLGELISFLVEGGDATNLFQLRAEVLEQKIEAI